MSYSATTPANRIVRQGPGKSLFEDCSQVVGTASWNQGDLICIDSSTHLLRAVSGQTDAVSICGIADNTIVSGKLSGPYDGLAGNNAAAGGPQFAGPKYGVVASMKLLSGDAFVHGQPVYLTTAGDAQTVTITAPSTNDPIGIYQGPSLTAGSASVGPVLIGSRYPNVAVSATIAASLSF